ncbi:AMIN-like domain-containing (lipo)protein [Streptomyces sp. URMC 123]|uniref:AMIN-like domain-containing (lipo)protein n=1 Tax=Streptomyces sp. URMC 123 TaxID=3423403 RepID=UPI003F1C4B1F
MRRLSAALTALTLAGLGLAATTPASASTAYAVTCDAAWGSADKTATDSDYKPLLDIRTGRHDCFDRMVLDVRGTAANPIGYRVGYVDQLHQDGSGDLVPVGGGAILEVRVAAPSYDPETGTPTYAGRVRQPLPGVDISGYRTFRDTRFAGSFEGDTQIGLGVRARLPFRVFQTGNHLVVDVAHSWSTGTTR